MTDPPDADGCVAIIHAALAAGDVTTVVAALHRLAVLDPHRADLIHQTLLLGIALADKEEATP